MLYFIGKRYREQLHEIADALVNGNGNYEIEYLSDIDGMACYFCRDGIRGEGIMITKHYSKTFLIRRFQFHSRLALHTECGETLKNLRGMI